MKNDPQLPTRRSLLRASMVAMPVLALHRAQAASAIAGVPPDHRLAFDVFRNGNRIGAHVLTFELENDRLTVDIDIRIQAGIGPLTLYRYEMRGTETWQNGIFSDLSTTTNANGTDHKVVVSRQADGLHVSSAGFPDKVLPGGTLPLTHWSRAALAGPLISPQDGQPMLATVTPLGSQSVELADGNRANATGFQVAARTTLQDWYDPMNIWVSLHADVHDGSHIDYRRM